MTFTKYHVLPLVGTVLLLAGGLWAWRSAYSIDHHAVTEGTVIANVFRGRYGYSPTITFSVPDGTAYTFTPHSSQKPAAYAPGDKVNVYYNPENPQNAKLSSFLSLWFGACMLAGFGSVVLVVGLMFMRRMP